MTPDAPTIRGTAQNPDTFFQAREACNRFYDAVPDIVQDEMDSLPAWWAASTSSSTTSARPMPNGSSW